MQWPGLIALKDSFDIAFGNDPNYDRHGIVTRSGLLAPNHYLAVAVNYLSKTVPSGPKGLKWAKPLLAGSMIDRVSHKLGLNLAEVPVGFKWFVDGLLTGDYGFGGEEESAGASFLRRMVRYGQPIKMAFVDLLAAEIMAVTGKTPPNTTKAPRVGIW
ncbi:MAG: hypothetical protein R2865_10995 [Deinococcales bacterium]